MSVKALVIDAVNQLPDDATSEQVVEHVQFVVGVQKALLEIDRGEGIPHEVASQRITEWLQKLPGRQAG